jgi:hypothetical protein
MSVKRDYLGREKGQEREGIRMGNGKVNMIKVH